MASLLLSYTITEPRVDPIGQRVWDDGRAEMYRTSRRVKGPDGVHRTERLDPGWYQAATLSAAQLAAVREAIEAADIAAIPEEVTTFDEGYSASSSAEWQIQTPAGLKYIRVTQWGPLDEAALPLMDLLLRVSTLINLAIAGVQEPSG